MTDQYQQAVEAGEVLCVQYLNLAKCRDDYTPIMIARELVPLFLSLSGDWGRVAVVGKSWESPAGELFEEIKPEPETFTEVTDGVVYVYKDETRTYLIKSYLEPKKLEPKVDKTWHDDDGI